VDRRSALAFGGVGLLAASAGALLAPIALQRSSGAAALLSTIFPDLEGNARRLRDWEGLVTVTNFWATWCEPCREEIPLFIAARAQYREEGVEVVGIGIDQVDKIRDYAAKHGVTYPVLVGDMRALDVMRELGNQSGALPYTVILDRRGRVVERRLGAYKAGELDQILAHILR